jgi:membrane protease YdiL (CAAX protease family)
VTDPTDQPSPPASDPWGRRTPPREPGGPSWAGPWSTPQGDQTQGDQTQGDQAQEGQPGEGRTGEPAGAGNGWQSPWGQAPGAQPAARQPTWGPPPRRPPGQPGAPERNPVPPPPASPRVLWLELGLVLLLAFAPGILSLLLASIGSANDNSAADQLLPAIVSGVFTLFLSWSPVLLVGYLLIRSGEGRQGIGLGRFDGRADGLTGLGLWVASFVLVLILARVFQFLGQNQVDFLPNELPLWFRIVEAFVIAITAGVTEEVVVRGYAQTRLEQLRAPTAVILLLPTALWGLLHLYEGPGSAATIFCLGMLYAWYYHRTRRLWPIIIAHALFDLTQLTLLLSQPPS